MATTSDHVRGSVRDSLTLQDSLTLKVDTLRPMRLRSPGGRLAEKYSGREFQYDIRDGESRNLITRGLNWFIGLLRDTFGIDIPPGAAQVLEYVIYVLLAILIIWLIVRLLAGEKLSAILSKKAAAHPDIPYFEGHLEDIDLDLLIARSLDRKDYRMAVRYRYLKALKVLSLHKVITWQYEKTNSDYQEEISAPLIKALFKEVSYLYDYIWYGEQPIDEKKYLAAMVRFTTLENHIVP